MLLHHLPQHLRIVDDHTGAFEVGDIVVGKLPADRLEEGGVRCFEDRGLPDVVYTEVGNHTGLYPSGVQDVQVLPGAGQADPIYPMP